MQTGFSNQFSDQSPTKQSVAVIPQEGTVQPDRETLTLIKKHLEVLQEL